MNNRTNIIITLLFAASCAFVSCDDWTDIESIDIKQPSIEEQNPELYTKYLENLRQYKAEPEHKKVYGWFDNSEKSPSSRSQHLINLPDSLDAISLMYPENLVDWELEEIAETREKKGTKVIYTIDFDAIKFAYNSKSEVAKEKEPVTDDFKGFLIDTLQHSLSILKKYSYDGICIAYKGKSMRHLPENERREYIQNESCFIGIINDWIWRNPEANIAFVGKPQNLYDNSILKNCQLIFVWGTDATSVDMLTYTFSIAACDGVDKNRLGILVEPPLPNDLDKETGYFQNGKPAIQELSSWVKGSHNGLKVSGVAIYNISADYFNVSKDYMHTRNVIAALNPSIK